MSPRERAEKEAKSLMFYDRYTEEGFADRIERIINEAIQEDRKERETIQVSTMIAKGLSQVVGSIVGNAALRAAAASKLIEYEREACAKICDDFWEKHCQMEDNCFIVPGGAAKLAVNQVALKIRARGEKREPGDSENRSTGIRNPIRYRIKKAVEREREACAKIADEHRLKIQDHYEHYEDRCADLSSDATARSIAGEIRARGEKS